MCVWAVKNPLLFLFRDEGSSYTELSHSIPALSLTHKLADKTMTSSSGTLQQARLNPLDSPSQAIKGKNLAKPDSFLVISDYKCVHFDNSLMQERSINTSVLVEGESRHCETCLKWNSTLFLRNNGFKGSYAVLVQCWLGHLCSLGSAWGTVAGTPTCLVDHRCIKQGDIWLSQHFLTELCIWI